MTIDIKIPKPPPDENDRLPQIIDQSNLGIDPNALRPINSALKINEALPNLVRGEPTALLLDINNLYKRADGNGFRIDYTNLAAIFRQRCDLRYCAAFSAVDRTDPRSNRWVEYMHKRGYAVITKELKQYRNDEGIHIAKGNMDIELTIAAMKLSPGFAHVIVGSCDGDFVPLINELHDGHFRKVSVLGMTNDNWTGMSSSLIRAADNFYDLSAIREHIEYVGTGRD